MPTSSRTDEANAAAALSETPYLSDIFARDGRHNLFCGLCSRPFLEELVGALQGILRGGKSLSDSDVDISELDFSGTSHCPIRDF